MKRILLLIALLSGTSWAHTSGNDLVEYCTAALKDESGARAGLCLGYINAFRELAEMLPAEKLLCVPEGVGNKQFIKVVMKHLDEHPEKLHMPAPQLIYDATQEVFPCSADAKK